MLDATRSTLVKAAARLRQVATTRLKLLRVCDQDRASPEALVLPPDHKPPNQRQEQQQQTQTAVSQAVEQTNGINRQTGAEEKQGAKFESWTCMAAGIGARQMRPGLVQMKPAPINLKQAAEHQAAEELEDCLLTCLTEVRLQRAATLETRPVSVYEECDRGACAGRIGGAATSAYEESGGRPTRTISPDLRTNCILLERGKEGRGEEERGERVLSAVSGARIVEEQAVEQVPLVDEQVMMLGFSLDVQDEQARQSMMLQAESTRGRSSCGSLSHKQQQDLTCQLLKRQGPTRYYKQVRRDVELSGSFRDYTPEKQFATLTDALNQELCKTSPCAAPPTSALQGVRPASTRPKSRNTSPKRPRDLEQGHAVSVISAACIGVKAAVDCQVGGGEDGLGGGDTRGIVDLSCHNNVAKRRAGGGAGRDLERTRPLDCGDVKIMCDILKKAGMSCHRTAVGRIQDSLSHDQARLLAPLLTVRAPLLHLDLSGNHLELSGAHSEAQSKYISRMPLLENVRNER